MLFPDERWSDPWVLIIFTTSHLKFNSEFPLKSYRNNPIGKGGDRLPTSHLFFRGFQLAVKNFGLKVVGVRGDLPSNKLIPRWWQVNFFLECSPRKLGSMICNLTVAYSSNGLVQAPACHFVYFRLEEVRLVKYESKNQLSILFISEFDSHDTTSTWWFEEDRWWWDWPDSFLVSYHSRAGVCSAVHAFWHSIASCLTWSAISWTAGWENSFGIFSWDSGLFLIDTKQLGCWFQGDLSWAKKGDIWSPGSPRGQDFNAPGFHWHLPFWKAKFESMMFRISSGGICMDSYGYLEAFGVKSTKKNPRVCFLGWFLSINGVQRLGFQRIIRWLA